MTSRLLPIAATTVVRTWTRMYTCGLPRAERAARLAEIDSDLWEFEHDPEAPRGIWAATQILARLLIGIPDDFAWRMNVGATAQTAPVRALAAAGMMTGPRRISALGLSATIHVIAVPTVMWFAAHEPGPAPNPGDTTPGPATVQQIAPLASLWSQLVRHERKNDPLMNMPVQSVTTRGNERALDVVGVIAFAVAARLGSATPPHLPAQAPSSASGPSTETGIGHDVAEFAERYVRAVAPSHAFEVISIKPARSDDSRNMRMRVLPNGDLSASAVSVLLLLGFAYEVPLNPSPRLSGVPGWRETYDIEAKAPANAVPAALPESEKRRRVQAMIRGLLADRFKLAIRVEQKTMPVYALTVASGGQNLQKSTIAERNCIFDTGTPESCHTFIPGRGHPLNARAITMDDLAQYIENWTDVPVVNRTAVSGLFAVETEGWTPMRLPPRPPGNPPAVRFDDLPTIFTVLRTLGLELKRQEATVPVYTVEHIERPSGQ